MADHKDHAVPAEQPAGESEMSEAEIDRNLADSFPASDPPSWTLGTEHVEPQAQPTDAPDKSEEK